MRVKVARWGNSMAVRLPRDVVAAAGLADGQDLDIEVRDGVVSLRRPARRYTLEELIAGMDASASPPDLVDWGADRGSERLPDDDYVRGLITDADIVARRDDLRRR